MAIHIEAPGARMSHPRKPPGLVVAGDEGPSGSTPMVSPQSLAGFQQGGWLSAAAFFSFLYAMFMFAGKLQPQAPSNFCSAS